MKRSLLLPLALLAASVHADEIDDYIQSEMKRQKVPGLVYGIIQDGKLTRKGAFGTASIELNAPMKDNMLFEIGSATKPFTAMATLILMEEGKLSVDDRLDKHLEKLPDAWKGLTIRNLLNHTSGLPEYATTPEYTLTKEYEPDAMLEAMGKLPMDFPAGVTWSYTNTGFYLLGRIIEKHGGKPYFEFVKARILDPLGMKDTRISDPMQIIPNRAGRYFQAGPSIINSPPTQPNAGYSAGYLLSTIDDMAKWEAALRGGKFLKPETYKMMWSPTKLSSGPTRPYGFGWFVAKTNGHQVVWHHGNSAGYGATLTMFPDDKLAVIVMLNLYPVNADQFARGIASRLMPALAPVIPAEKSDPNPTLSKKLQDAMAMLAEGKLDEGVFAPELIATFSTSRGKMQRGGLAPVAKGKFAFAGDESEGGQKVYIYRVSTEQRKFTVRFAVLPDGKVSNISAQGDPAVVTK